MNISRWWIPVMLVGALLAGSACTQTSEDEAKEEAASIVKETKEADGEA